MGRPRKYFTEEEQKAARREYNKQYYQNNRDRIVKQQADYYQNNKEKFAEYNAEYYQKNKEKILEQITEKRITPIGKAQMHVDNYIRIDRAYKRGECTLTPEWIVEHIFSQPCHYCGKTDWTEIGCDRIDNSLPHTPDNVVPCCTDCNKKKARYSYDEFMKMIGKIA